MGGGQLGVDVGVKRTIDDTSLRDGEFVAVEPVPRRFDQRENGEDRRQVDLHTRRNPIATGNGHADTTVEVVRDRRKNQDDHERRERPVDDIAQERQLKDVKADVGVELGVGDAKVLSVREQQPLFPL